MATYGIRRGGTIWMWSGVYAHLLRIHGVPGDAIVVLADSHAKDGPVRSTWDEVLGLWIPTRDPNDDAPPTPRAA